MPSDKHTYLESLQWQQDKNKNRKGVIVTFLYQGHKGDSLMPPNMKPLTHWGWDKMDTISQTTFSNAFSWMKMYEFH